MNISTQYAPCLNIRYDYSIRTIPLSPADPPTMAGTVWGTYVVKDAERDMQELNRRLSGRIRQCNCPLCSTQLELYGR